MLALLSAAAVAAQPIPTDFDLATVTAQPPLVEVGPGIYTTDPETYKEMGKLVMNTTGSGNLLGMLENQKAQKILGSTFYGARLMAANFNTLNPMYYAKMPEGVRAEAMKDLAAYTTTMLATTLAAAAAGAKVQLDPEKSDFLQIRVGEKIYDITGGKAAYVRTFLRMVQAGYSRATKSKYEAGKDVEFAGNSVMSFFRNKLAPNTSYVVNAFAGKNSIGQPFDPLDIVKIYPMYADDALKAAKEDGVTSLFTVLLPNIIGIGYGSYYSDPEKQTLENTIDRNTRSDEMNPATLKNYNEGGRVITDDEFEKFTQKRDAKIENGIKKLYDGTAPENMVLDNGGVVKKKFSEMTKEQIVAATSSIKKKATEATKEEMFGKKERTREEKRQAAKLRAARKDINY